MAFPYTRHQANWQDGAAGGTPITETAMDTIEAGIKSLSDKLAAGSAGQYLKTVGSTPTWAAIPWNLIFTALANEPPAANFATLDTRNSHPVLDFDAATDEHAVFRGVLPSTYAAGGVNVKLIWAATSAITGTARWAVAWERIPVGAQDLDADSFATAKTAGGTADGVSGETTETTIPFSDGAEMDSVGAGEMFRLKVTRDADGTSGTDDMTGDAELIAVVITEQ